MKFWKNLLFIPILMISTGTISGSGNDSSVTVNVAIYCNYPFVYADSSKSPDGLYIELLKKIAAEHEWHINYVHTNLRDAIKLLRAGNIDIIPAIGFSTLRDSLFSLNEELIYLNWGAVYTRSDKSIRSVIDLEGQVIGVQYADMHAVEFQQLIKDFQVGCQLRWYGTYEDMRFALSVGQLDAVLFNRAYGDKFKHPMRLVSTPILLNPVEMKFAVSSQSKHLLSFIDREIKHLKTNDAQFFHTLVNQWTMPEPDFTVFQEWFYLFLLLFLLVIVSSLVILIVFLRTRFEEKSKQLEREKASRQDIEKRMEISEKEKSMILNSVSDLVLFLSPDNQVIWANNHFFKAFNKRIEEVQGKQFNEIVAIDQPNGIDDFSNGVQIKTRYQEYIIPDDQRVFKATVNPVFNENEQFQGYVKTMTDVTLQKHVENELLKAKEDAEESDKLKSAFLANMSHEIRTPMNAIIGFTELLEFDDTSIDEKSEYLKIIRSNGQHLMMLISDILVFSQIETGQLQIVRTSVDLNLILNEIYSQFAEDIRRQDSINSVKFELEKDIDDDAEIYTDPIRLRQVLYNLINNAIKFTPKGIIVLGCKCSKGNYLFYVKDTGVGIPEHKQELIFKRFEQVQENNGKKYTGTGLGLAICRELVYLLGGRIWLKSKEGAGSTFYFELPG